MSSQNDEQKDVIGFMFEVILYYSLGFLCTEDKVMLAFDQKAWGMGRKSSIRNLKLVGWLVVASKSI